MTEILLRPATRSDAADLAILDNLAGHGISMWFWQGAVKSGKSDDAMSWGRARLADDDAIYGWSNATIAVEDNIILGASTSYIMPTPDEDADAMKREAPPFVPVFELFAEAVGDWFVDSLAVYQEARGRGVGAKLLDDSLEKAGKTIANTASLVVEDGNDTALDLYLSRGFEQVSTRLYKPFDGPSNSKNWLLLKRKLQ